MAGDVELKSRGNSTDNHSTSTHSFHSGDASSLVSVKTGCFKLSPNSVRGRRCQMARMLILPFIPILALVAQNSTILSSAVTALWQVSEINGQISNTVQIGKLLAQVQMERAEIAYFMFSQSNQSRLALDSRFATTDDLIKNLSSLVANEILSGRDVSFQNHLSEMQLKRKRILELASLNTSKCDEEALDEMVWYNQANDLILDQLGRKVRETNTGLWRALVAYSNMIKAIENLSIAMVYGFYYYCKGYLTPRSLSKYIRYDSLAEEYLNLTFHFSLDVFEEFGSYDLSHGHFSELRRELKIQPGWFNSVRLFGLNRREVVYENEFMAPDAAGAEVYFHNMTKYLELLKSYERHLLVVTRKQIVDEMNSAKSQQLISAIMFTVILIVSPIIIILIKSMMNTIQDYSTILARKTTALKEEKKRSDRLLNQMLPSPVVRQLKLKKQVPAESFESVTIYFSDIVNFTRLSSSSSPMEIVIMLNSLYQIFDSRIEHYDVYKVETIGDAYMVVSGLPNKNGIQHAGEISTMALDLLNGVRMFEIPHRPSETLSIRIGINTGPCVAGVIGTKMPRYCLFGDAINTASRMESNGEAMKVHITEDTKVLLDAIGGYFTESRGTVEIKGKGEMNTFWLIGKEGGLPRSIEVSTPGYLKPVIKPEFVRDIFGEQFDYDDDD